jgi:hypothetical protein
VIGRFDFQCLGELLMVNSKSWHKSRTSRAFAPKLRVERQQAWRFPPITRDDGDSGYLTENIPFFIFLRIPVTNRRKLPFTKRRNSRRCFRCDLLGYFGVKLLELGARKDFFARRS